jgi:hypothetical protein
MLLEQSGLVCLLMLSRLIFKSSIDGGQSPVQHCWISRLSEVGPAVDEHRLTVD